VTRQGLGKDPMHINWGGGYGYDSW